MDRAWATEAYEALTQGRVVQVRPRGDSMKGRINDGDLVTLEPCVAEELAVGDIVFVRVRGWLLVLHQIFDREPDRFLIGTTTGRAYGWVTADDIIGRVTKVEP